MHAFDRVDNENFFEIPMLRQKGTWVRRHILELQPRRTGALQIENPSARDVELSLSVKIKSRSVEDLFVNLSARRRIPTLSATFEIFLINLRRSCSARAISCFTATGTAFS